MRKYLRIIGLTAILLIFQAGTALANQTVHTVKAGDTLWDIANKYGVSVSSLQQNNGLSSERLQIGMKLIVNSTTSTRSQTSSLVPDSNTIYTVRNGDNLWAIASKYNTTVEQLMSLNNLSSDRLNVGDQLYVKAVSRPATTPTASRAVYPKPVTPPPAPVVTEQQNSSTESTGDETETDLGTQICNFGAKYLGTPYRYGGSGPGGFDCSGFVGYVYKQHGYNLPRTAAGIYGVGVAVDKANLRPGDLLFFKGRGTSYINHVGIYVSDNKFIHSSSPNSGGVIYSYLNSAYYSQTYVGAKRVLPE
jgi:cell wall-associated NlpC family hydrolase